MHLIVSLSSLLIATHVPAAAGFSPPTFLFRNNHKRSNHVKLYDQVNPLDDEDMMMMNAPIMLDTADDNDCDIASRFGNNTTPSKLVFLMSDSTGATLKTSVQKSLAQFDSCSDERFYSIGSKQKGEQDCLVKTRVFTFIRGEAAVAAIIKKAQEKGALVIFTIVEPTLRLATLKMCELSQVSVIDLLGPTLSGLSEFLDKPPMGVPLYIPKRRVALSDQYFKRIQAVEFTLKADDGQSPWLLKEADVIIVGVSRTGKTPLSVVLSQTMGLKVANVPLVLECAAPQELFDDDIDSDRVFCLTIAPSELKKIRTSRLMRRSVKQMEEQYNFEPQAKSNYADRAYLLQDLKQARALARDHGWTEIDVTGRAVEETASYISELMNERFDEEECV